MELKLDSLAMQEQAPAYEIVLVDDGSTDGSPLICDRFAEKHPNTLVIHQKNSGPGPARNVGVSVSSGDWIMLVDSDDRLTPDALALFDAAMSANPQSEMISGGFLRIKPNEIWGGRNKSGLPISTIARADAIKHLYDADHSFFMTACNKLFKKTLFEKLTFEHIFHEDIVFIFPAFLLTEFITVIHLETYLYVQRSGSIMHSPSAGRCFDLCRALLSRERFAIASGYFEFVGMDLCCIADILTNSMTFPSSRDLEYKVVKKSAKELFLINRKHIRWSHKGRLALFFCCPSMYRFFLGKKS